MTLTESEIQSYVGQPLVKALKQELWAARREELP